MTIDSKFWKEADTPKQLEDILEKEGKDKDILIFFSKVNCLGCNGTKKYFGPEQEGKFYIQRKDVLPIFIEKTSLDDFGEFIKYGYEVESFPYILILDGRKDYRQIGVATLLPLVHILIGSRYIELEKK